METENQVNEYAGHPVPVITKHEINHALLCPEFRVQLLNKITIGVIVITSQCCKAKNLERLDLEALQCKALKPIKRQVMRGCGNIWRTMENDTVENTRLWSYVHRCVFSAALKMLRSKQYQITKLCGYQSDLFVDEHSPHDALEIIIKEYEWDLILGRRLRLLTERERVVIYLRFLQGHTSGQVSDALGISKSCVKSRTRRALRKLKGDYSDD